MKVVCINNKGISDWITIGKIYEVIEEYDHNWNSGCYKILDDSSNQYVIVPNNFFKTLSEIRNKKINKLLDL